MPREACSAKAPGASGGGGQGGGGGLGGGGGQGGIGAVGGIAGSDGAGGSDGTGTFGAGGPQVGGSAPAIPPVQRHSPNLATGTISVTRGSRTLGGIQVVAGQKPPGPTAPLVFYWHGTGGQASEFGVHAAAVRDGVVQEGGILVSFQGTTGGDLLSGALIFGAGDFELVDQIVACAVQNYNVDPRRIFATGSARVAFFDRHGGSTLELRGRRGAELRRLVGSGAVAEREHTGADDGSRRARRRRGDRRLLGHQQNGG